MCQHIPICFDIISYRMFEEHWGLTQNSSAAMQENRWLPRHPDGLLGFLGIGCRHRKILPGNLSAHQQPSFLVPAVSSVRRSSVIPRSSLQKLGCRSVECGRVLVRLCKTSKSESLRSKSLRVAPSHSLSSISTHTSKLEDPQIPRPFR